MSRQVLVDRMRAEYLEMPGLRLTAKQASRLWDVEPTLCRGALDTLVGTGFLVLRNDGSFVRASEGRIPRPHPAKADAPPPVHSAAS